MTRMKRGRFALLVGAAWMLLCSQRLGAHAFTTISLVVRSIPKGLTTCNFDGRNRQRRLFSTVYPGRARQKVATNEEHVPTTMSEAVHRFFLGPDRGPVCVLGMLTLLFGWRLAFPVTPLDIVAFVGMTLCWWIQEHVFHGKLLHSSRDWMGKEIHASHHAKPYFHVSIDPAYLMVGWLVGAHMLLRLALPLPCALSATLGYVVSGLFYEWAHFIVHTRVRPPNAFLKKVRDNHIKHHLVDDRYWLSFTVPLVDDFFGTNPQVAEVRRKQAMAVEERENGCDESPAIGTDVARSVPK